MKEKGKVNQQKKPRPIRATAYFYNILILNIHFEY